MPAPLIEFPADDPDRARRIWHVGELGGSIIHPGDRWAVCGDSEGNPFALAAAPAPGK
jgi:hypothetical protein